MAIVSQINHASRCTRLRLMEASFLVLNGICSIVRWSTSQLLMVGESDFRKLYVMCIHDPPDFFVFISRMSNKNALIV